MGKGKVLVVDDEDDLRDGISQLLIVQGFTVLEARSGKEALGILDTDPNIVFVISDVRMPNGDGMYLLDEIRKRHPEIPVVLLLTGFSEHSEKDAINRGAIAMLSKPPDFDVINRYLSQCGTLF